MIDKAKIEIAKNPAGYSQGTWGYIVRLDGDAWADGGYCDRDDAMEAARRHLDLLTRAESE